jgi:hypothetical protein
MACRRQDQAELSLGDGGFFAIFLEAMLAAHKRYWDKYGEDAYCVRSVSRANLIRDFAVDELRKGLDGRPLVRIIDENQTAYIYIGIDWMIVVHKLHEDFTIALNDNQVSLGLNDNQPVQSGLPGIPDEATVLQLGYVETLADRFAPQVFLVCPNGHAPAWVIPLKPSVPPTPQEITPDDPAGDPDRVRVRINNKDLEQGSKQ